MDISPPTTKRNFIDEFQAFVDWHEISQFQNLSEAFIREF